MVLEGIVNYLKLSKTEGKKVTILENSVNLQITKFMDITTKIIPFFDKYPIEGIKKLDFLNFKEVCEILKTKDHLKNPKALNKIIEIKSNMNLNRKL